MELLGTVSSKNFFVIVCNPIFLLRGILHDPCFGALGTVSSVNFFFCNSICLFLVILHEPVL